MFLVSDRPWPVRFGLGTVADSTGTVLFDTTMAVGSMPSRKSAPLSSMALALIAVVFTATAIGTVFHDKY